MQSDVLKLIFFESYTIHQSITILISSEIELVLEN